MEQISRYRRNTPRMDINKENNEHNDIHALPNPSHLIGNQMSQEPNPYSLLKRLSESLIQNHTRPKTEEEIFESLQPYIDEEHRLFRLKYPNYPYFDTPDTTPTKRTPEEEATLEAEYQNRTRNKRASTFNYEGRIIECPPQLPDWTKYLIIPVIWDTWIKVANCVAIMPGSCGELFEKCPVGELYNY
jgi:hypothetical protein